MMRFPGNAVAKSFRLVRSQYRHCSSMSAKDVAMGDMELLVDNMAGLFFTGAFGVFGFVVGGFTSTGISAELKKEEEDIIEMQQMSVERQMNMELLRKNQEERNRRYFSR